MPRQSALIYDAADDHNKILKHVLAQMEYTTTTVSTPLELERCSSTIKPNVIIVEAQMPYAPLISTAQFILCGLPQHLNTALLAYYKIAHLLPRPFTSFEATELLMRMSRTGTAMTSFPENTLRLISHIKEMKILHETVQQEDTMKFTLKESALYFCAFRCNLARTAAELSNESLTTYECLALGTGDSQRYCNLKNTCQLQLFLSWLQGTQATLLHRPLVPLHEDEASRTMSCTLDSLYTAYIQNLQKKLDILYEAKTEYCTKQCPSCTHGIAFAKGDSLFSKWNELISGSCHFCSKHTCPLDAFFAVCKTMIV